MKRTSSEVLDEVFSVVPQRLTVKSVKHSVSSSISGSGTSVSLSSLSVLERLSSESTLVDLAFLGTGEGESEMFKFEDSRG